MAKNKITINRAAVLTLWAAVVAERLGHGKQEALTLGRAVAGLNAQSKGRRIGIYAEKTEEEKEKEKKEAKSSRLPMVDIMGRSVPVAKTPHGPRASVKGETIDPDSVEKYLEQKFGDQLGETRAALEHLARAYSPHELEFACIRPLRKVSPGDPGRQEGLGREGRARPGLYPFAGEVSAPVVPAADARSITRFPHIYS